MASIKTPLGRLYYKPVNLYVGIKQMNRDIAFDNLKVLLQVLRELNICATPAYGTLLGIIRENNFIEWDEDIDLFILKEDQERLLNAFWKLKEKGFELIRVDRCGHLYSIMRKNEYIDFYIMTSISPELRTTYGGGFIFEKYLTDLVKYNFRGLTINVPREYENCLEFMYGDWRTPAKYANFKMSKTAIFKAKLLNILKNSLPYSIHFQLLKKYHKKDLDKFLIKCKQKGITLHYSINY